MKRALPSLLVAAVAPLVAAACDDAAGAGASSAGASGATGATGEARDEVGLAVAPYRPDDPDSDALFRFEPGYDVETYDGELVRVFFTRDGPDKVRALDDDADGVPDAVVTVAEAYDEVLETYAGIGFRPPLTDVGTAQGDGGDGRLDVYLVDFAGASDGAWVRERCESDAPRCSGYVAQENDFAGYGYPSYRVATRILASHELFHAVQAAYDANQGANWSEATAVWASERFDPSLSDLEHFADGWLENPDRSIDQEPTGPVDAYSYGLGIFAQYLWERFGDTLHTKLWAASEDGANGVADPHWVSALAALLERDFATDFASEWLTFATWVLRAGHDASGGPTFASAAVLPRVARDVEDLPFQDDKLRVYPTSLQVWSAKVGELAVAVVHVAEGDTDGVRLVTATRDGDTVTTTVHDGLEAVVEGAGADEVIVAVVNTNLEGNSKRPGFCLGSVADVEACKASLAPPVAEPAPEVTEAGPEVVEVSEDGPEAVEVVEAGDAAEGEDTSSGAEVEAESGGGAKDDGCAGGANGGLAGVIGALGLVVSLRRQRLAAPRL